MDVIINTNCDFIPEGAKALASQGDSLLNLLACLNYSSEYPPLADLLKLHYQLEGDWFILSPVQWHASHNNAAISAFGTALELNESELKNHFHSLAEHFMADGMTLYYHEPHTWLLSAPNKSGLTAKAVHHVLNKPVMPELALMDSTFFWQKILTESQMFFASKHANSIINGIWLWGGGTLGAKNNKRIAADACFLELAQHCSNQVSVYKPGLSLNEVDLLVLDDLSVLSTAHKEQLKKTASRWYWNNTGYDLPHVSCLTRLWRTLTHAH